MTVQERFVRNGLVATATVLSGAFLLVFVASCARRVDQPPTPTRPTVRIGVGQIQVNGLVQNMTLEALARVGTDGRMVNRLAKGWSLSSDGLSLTVELRPGLTFHDGSPVTTALVADVLSAKLKNMGPAVDDVISVVPVSDDRVEFTLRRPSRFAVEALEATIEKPGSPGIGTGAFKADGKPGEMRANDGYYLGAPNAERIVVSSSPGLRKNWADFLRGDLDVIYEVGPDARDSLQSSTLVNVFPVSRPYQYVVLFNAKSTAGRSSAIKRALNAAIDRAAFVKEALGNHGQPSSGPIWPRHWAAQANLPTFTLDPASAAETLKTIQGKLRFTCIVAPPDERAALVVKRQLQAVGVEMIPEQRSLDDTLLAMRSGDFDGVLLAINSGPSLLRSYDWWHSKGTRNAFKYSNPAVDTALDAIRHARSDDEYQAGVVAFQNAILDDPPAIFLAWDEQARVASKRFDIQVDPGADMMGTLRLWRLARPSPSLN